jgi:hypothetical protein
MSRASTISMGLAGFGRHTEASFYRISVHPDRPERPNAIGRVLGQPDTQILVFEAGEQNSQNPVTMSQRPGARLCLLTGSRLAELMIEFGAAVATDATYIVKRIDNDLFESI